MTALANVAATEKQIRFIKDMAKELLGTDELADQFLVKLHEDGALQSRALVSGVIDDLVRRRSSARAAHRVAAAAAAAPELEAGMYRTSDGMIYKVQKAVHGSGKMYAKKLVPPASFGENAQFVYAPGIIRTLTEADKMTLEDAKAFGALYGTCCVCGRTLTDERSIENGIGPVCARRF